MSVLVLSADDEAAGSLCAALSRAGQRAYWETCLEAAQDRAQRMPPLVLVVDAAIEGHDQLVVDVRKTRPWTRVHLMVDPGETLPADLGTLVSKPFDAAELADMLTREQELAELDRGRRELERELEHSERLAAVGRLAASMAHEINNPLAVIMASATYLSEVARDSSDPELAECAADLELAAERIGSFVQHVCGFARRERPQLTDAPVAIGIEMALRMIRPRAKDKQVRIDVEPLPEVRAPHDPPRLSQAILNVLANAVDAAASRGRRVEVSLREEAGRALVRVDDDGPGIDAAIADKLFEPFATTKPPGQGTGLGLAITRQILSDHGGEVRLTSRGAGGARAELSIPLLDTSSHTVLVVDGDASLRRALVAELRRGGFSVKIAATPAEVREIAAAEPISVMVVDLQPGSDELLESLRSASASSKILAVTSELRAPDAADGILSKPWNSEQFQRVVRDLCVAGGNTL